MKKAIVIGSNGQDGYYLANFLAQKKYKVICIDKGFLLQIPESNIDLRLNISNKSHIELLISKIKPDEIYHLAAFHHSAQDNYDETIDIFTKSIEVHDISLFHILNSIVKFSPQTKLFYAASSLIFGNPPTEVQNESTPINPNNLYGITKAVGLFLCRKYRKEHNVFASCGILYNHESSRRPSKYLSKKIIDGVINALRDHEEKIELGNLKAEVDWGFAPDFIKAMYQITNLEISDDFIVSTGVKHTVKEFAEIAYSSVGLYWRDHVVENPQLIKRETKPLIGDSSKLRRLTKWAPSISFEDMVKLLVKESINNEKH
jgi:GDPmannose 4,6-dehydratase